MIGVFLHNGTKVLFFFDMCKKKRCEICFFLHMSKKSSTFAPRKGAETKKAHQ